jgi:hypothetical protein
MDNPHQCVVWPLQGPCQMEAQFKVHCHFHNIKCKEVFWLFVSSLITPSSTSLDKHSQRRLYIQITKQLKIDYLDVTLITMMQIHLVATKIDSLEIGIIFYFLPMVDQTLNQNHKVGHHKKITPRNFFYKTTI